MREHLLVAEDSAARWPGTAWGAAAMEARAHLAVAEGHSAESVMLLDAAAEGFTAAGQPRDAGRCLSTRDEIQLGAAPR